MTNNDKRIVQLETALMIIESVHSDICNDITMDRNDPRTQATLNMVLSVIQNIEVFKKKLKRRQCYDY